MNYRQRVEREDEGDRLRGVLADEAEASDAAIRAAFHEVALGLMEWRQPPLMSAREYRRLEGITGNGNVYRPHCAQDDVEPYDLDRDDDEWGRHAR